MYTAANIVPEIIIVWWIPVEWDGLTPSLSPYSSPVVDIPVADFSLLLLSLSFSPNFSCDLYVCYSHICHTLTHLTHFPTLQSKVSPPAADRILILWKPKHRATSTCFTLSSLFLLKTRHVFSEVTNSALIFMMLAPEITLEQLEQEFQDYFLCPSSHTINLKLFLSFPFVFLGPRLWHMGVPRLGVESEL